MVPQLSQRYDELLEASVRVIIHVCPVGDEFLEATILEANLDRVRIGSPIFIMNGNECDLFHGIGIDGNDNTSIGNEYGHHGAFLLLE